MKRFAVIAWILICVAAFAWRGHACIVENSATFDEAAHLAAGYSYWSRGDFRLNIESPPFAKLFVSLPLFVAKHVHFDPPADLWNEANEWKIGNHFLFDNGTDPQELLAWGRWTNWTLGLATILLLGWWARRCFGWTAGCLALGFACFEPNILALSCIVNTDIALAFSCLASCYFGWEYARKPARWSFALSGVALGLALASKFSAVFWVAGFLPAWWLSSHKTDRRPFEEMFRLLLITAVTILPCYFFVHFADWGRGFKQQLVRNDFDTSRFYLFGENSTKGWFHYFFVAIVYKTLMGLLLVWFWGLAAFRNWGRDGRAFLWLPPLGYFLAMSLLRVDIGIRIILPSLVFVPLQASAVTKMRDRRVPLIAGLLLAFTALNLLPIKGRELTFATRWFVDPEKVLGDSNLDWGQDLLRLKTWMAKNGQESVWLAYIGNAPPRSYGIFCIPLPAWGKLEPWPDPPRGEPQFLAVSVAALQGTYLKDPEMYAKLRDLAPVDRLGGAIYIYRVGETGISVDWLRELHRREIGEGDK